MKKITFYGKDFSDISAAKVYNHENGEKDIIVESKYYDLLVHFLNTYQNKETNIELRFPKNPQLFNKYVGVFRIKNLTFGEDIYDVTLEISCRFDTDNRAFFLLAMLLCLDTNELHLIKPDVNITFHQVMDIFLLFMFKNQLADAAKKGLFRKYQRFENNDSRPHGSINTARHIRENMGLNNGKIAYDYRELTANNPVNRLISAAYMRLCEKYSGLCEKNINNDESVYSVIKMLQTELGYSKTNVRNIVKENLRPITHPYFSEYEALRKTCLKILRDENVSIFDADCSEGTDAIYFNITDLWEKYLEFQFRRQDLKSMGLKLFAQAEDKFLYPKGNKNDNKKAKPVFLFGKDGINKVAKPDFLFKKDDKNAAILDAKFKRQWKERSTDFLTADIDECLRNMVVFQAYRTGVIYPSNDKSESEIVNPIELNIIGEKTCEKNEPFLPFDIVEIAIPEMDGSSFEDWNKRLDENVSGVLIKYLNLLNPNNP